MKKDKQNEQDYKLWVMLEQAESAAFAAREKELAKYKTSPMQTEVLFIVEQIGPEATPAEISRWLLRRSHSVSGLLDRMEKDGLITKSKDLHRKNLVRVTITDKGYKALENARKRVFIQRIMSVLSDEERPQFYKMLEKVRNRALKLAAISPKPPYPKSFP